MTSSYLNIRETKVLKNMYLKDISNYFKNVKALLPA